MLILIEKAFHNLSRKIGIILLITLNFFPVKFIRRLIRLIQMILRSKFKVIS